MTEARERLLWLVLLAAVAAALGRAALTSRIPGARFLQFLELKTYDARLRLLPAREPSPEVVIAAIDQPSLQQYGRWPWDRSLHARLIDRLTAAAARVIAFDVSFAEPAGAAQDAALVEAVRRSGRVVLVQSVTYDEEGRPRSDRLVRGLEEAARLGSAGVDLGPDGAVRTSPPMDGSWREAGMPAPFAVAVLEQYFGEPLYPPLPGFQEEVVVGDRRIPVTPDEHRLLIRFPGRPFRRYSFADLAEGRVGPGAVRGRIVLVVHTAHELDRYPVPRTPRGGPGRLPGGLIHAAILDTVLEEDYLQRAGLATNWLLGCGLLALGVWILYRFPLGRALGLLAALGAGYGAAVFLVFLQQRVWLDLAVPLFMLGGTVFGALIYENRRVREAFGRFVPRRAVEEVLASPEALDRREDRVVTVLFVDLRGYTGLSERRTPDEMAAILRRFHQAMGEVYQRRGGYVTSYQGDAQMVVFGAPEPDPQHARAALEAAVEMRAAMVDLNRELARHYPELGPGLRVGIGLCTGPVSLGFVGDRDRYEYAALGDTTNTAARLQAVARDVGTDIVVSATTARAAGVEEQLEPLPPVPLKGKAEPHPIFAVPSGWRGEEG